MLSFLRGALSFPHGVHPPDSKDLTAGVPIRRMPFPDELVLPLSQNAGAPARLLVKPGDRVERGDMIGAARGFVSVPVHASAAGVVEAVEQEEGAIAEAVARLAPDVDLIIFAGQTSVMGEEDDTLRALRRAGADLTLSGAPVEPGNLLALAYLPGTPVLCAPGSAKGMRRNVVDVVLPRLLLGDRLDRREIAALGLGGFLSAAERAGDA